ncbi:hypothetical protein BHC47_06060 [Snodgrassella alvi]|uniref:Uncharacterized protein n=1 Tax=Snodgrassella alvi TaxID=1196083 RepID=A0A2N9Y3L5_9NEIS|nr:hypothetical protein BHC56_01150 [Snodgrassella alvi]PIT62052.1 hypothetical protein BHC47_06060 [Snodgrassella alvi]
MPALAGFLISYRGDICLLYMENHYKKKEPESAEVANMKFQMKQQCERLRKILERIRFPQIIHLKNSA